ncbi:hypothetical protein [Kineosporia sp. NBRC 101731]|uniref:hypothetical protein n=1 Tax=Kineosporia sp. NBRC 101731 TaxID=3032199 RepID=UPI0024A05E39|nr:hypothetical protein [Kineosporia sp. NBRC 101731]GLY28587.1 hypothetical protein Kisp02_19520 [Kineosporia sp. NBRC 101731]
MEQIRARVEVLESEIGRLRGESAGTRVLAAEADREVSSASEALRAHVGGLNALRQTQVEQSGTLREIANAVGALAVGQHGLTERVDKVEGRLGTLEGKVDALVSGQQAQNEMLAGLTTAIQRLSERG